MTAARSMLDAVYDNEAQRARQVFLTQPVGGGKVVDFTWAQMPCHAAGLVHHLRPREVDDLAAAWHGTCARAA